MIQKGKILGVALAAAMTLSAIAASAASAVDHQFQVVGSGTITAANLTTLEFENETGGGNVNGCNEVTMEGEGKEGKQESLTLTPSFKGCGVFENGKLTKSMNFEMNGCKFQFTGKTTAGNPTGGEHANVHLQCPEGKAIETRITALKIKCSSIPPQEIKHAVRYENETTGDKTTHVRAIITAHSVHSTTHSMCGEGTPTNGRLTAELRLKGPKGISI